MNDVWAMASNRHGTGRGEENELFSGRDGQGRRGRTVTWQETCIDYKSLS